MRLTVHWGTKTMPSYKGSFTYESYKIEELLKNKVSEMNPVEKQNVQIISITGKNDKVDTKD